MSKEEDWDNLDDMPEEDNDSDDIADDDWDLENDAADYVGDGDITNSLQLANKTLEPSEIVGKLPEALKETRIAFLSEGGAKEIKHKARNYDNLRYIKKVLQLQKKEDDMIIKRKKKLYQIKSKDDLKKYLQSINRMYLYNIIKDSKEIDQVLVNIQHLKPSGLAEDIQKMTTDLATHYEVYNTENEMTKNIDDSGMVQGIAMESVVSSGQGGNERLALITTLSATRNIDTQKQTEIQEKNPALLSTAKKVWSKWAK